MAGSSPARRTHPSHLPHLELASGRLRSQEVLTLHDSLTMGLGFLGKGMRAGVALGAGMENRCPLPPPTPAPQAAAGPEGGGRAYSPGSPLPQAWELGKPPLPGADLTAPWLGWGQPGVTREGRNLLVGESPESCPGRGPGWRRKGEGGPPHNQHPSLGGGFSRNWRTGGAQRPSARTWGTR